jgi:hypothetical protein
MSLEKGQSQDLQRLGRLAYYKVYIRTKRGHVA